MTEHIETPELRSAKALRKAAWVIFIFQLIFFLIFMVRGWEDILKGAVLTIAIAVYALTFTGLMLDILIKPIEQLNYRATEVKLILTIVLFCIPAIGSAYFWLIISR